jgi:hypothetical protein
VGKTQELVQRFRDTSGDSLKERWVGRGEGMMEEGRGRGSWAALPLHTV